MRSIAAIALLLAAGGCSLTRPIHGVIEGTGETFTGTATGNFDDTGNIAVRSNRTACSGTFVYTTFRQGAGTLLCEDGRRVPFSFTSSGWKGSGGTAVFGRRRVVFTFG